MNTPAAPRFADFAARLAPAIRFGPRTHTEHLAYGIDTSGTSDRPKARQAPSDEKVTISRPPRSNAVGASLDTETCAAGVGHGRACAGFNDKGRCSAQGRYAQVPSHTRSFEELEDSP